MFCWKQIVERKPLHWTDAEDLRSLSVGEAMPMAFVNGQWRGCCERLTERRCGAMLHYAAATEVAQAHGLSQELASWLHFYTLVDELAKLVVG